MNIEKDEIEKVANYAESRWGKWGKILVGALAGALIAGGIFTLSGCGTTVTVSSDQGMLEINSNGVVIYTPPIYETKK